jgi:hypothetical protein
MAFFLSQKIADRLLVAAGRPTARQCHHVNGRTTWRWHVDNDDDRYVEVVDFVHSNKVVIIKVDGTTASIAVIDNVDDMSMCIATWISDLVKNLGKVVG